MEDQNKLFIDFVNIYEFLMIEKYLKYLIFR